MASTDDKLQSPSLSQINISENDAERQLDGNKSKCSKDIKDGFGFKYLKKYGWYEGDGLGKNKHGCLEIVSIKILEKHFGNTDLNCLRKSTESDASSEENIEGCPAITVENSPVHSNGNSEVLKDESKTNDASNIPTSLMGVTPFTLTKKTVAKVSSLLVFEESSGNVKNSQNNEKDKLDNHKYLYEPSPILRNKISWALMKFIKPENESDTYYSLKVELNVEKALLSFITVIKRDDVTELQWPLEMIQLTQTEPKISYGCNPLDFDIAGLKKSSTLKSIPDVNILTRNRVDTSSKEMSDDHSPSLGNKSMDANLAVKEVIKTKKHKKHKHKTDSDLNKSDKTHKRKKSKKKKKKIVPESVASSLHTENVKEMKNVFLEIKKETQPDLDDGNKVTTLDVKDKKKKRKKKKKKSNKNHKDSNPKLVSEIDLLSINQKKKLYKQKKSSLQSLKISTETPSEYKNIPIDSQLKDSKLHLFNENFTMMKENNISFDNESHLHMKENLFSNGLTKKEPLFDSSKKYESISNLSPLIKDQFKENSHETGYSKWDTSSDSEMESIVKKTKESIEVKPQSKINPSDKHLLNNCRNLSNTNHMGNNLDVDQESRAKSAKHDVLNSLNTETNFDISCHEHSKIISYSNDQNEVADPEKNDKKEKLAHRSRSLIKKRIRRTHSAYSSDSDYESRRRRSRDRSYSSYSYSGHSASYSRSRSHSKNSRYSRSSSENYHRGRSRSYSHDSSRSHSRSYSRTRCRRYRSYSSYSRSSDSSYSSSRSRSRHHSFSRSRSRSISHRRSRGNEIRRMLIKSSPNKEFSATSKKDSVNLKKNRKDCLNEVISNDKISMPKKDIDDYDLDFLKTSDIIPHVEDITAYPLSLFAGKKKNADDEDNEYHQSHPNHYNNGRSSMAMTQHNQNHNQNLSTNNSGPNVILPPNYTPRDPAYFPGPTTRGPQPRMPPIRPPGPHGHPGSVNHRGPMGMGSRMPHGPPLRGPGGPLPRGPGSYGGPPPPPRGPGGPPPPPPPRGPGSVVRGPGVPPPRGHISAPRGPPPPPRGPSPVPPRPNSIHRPSVDQNQRVVRGVSPGRQNGSADSFIGPVLPENHPLAVAQEIPAQNESLPLPRSTVTSITSAPRINQSLPRSPIELLRPRAPIMMSRNDIISQPPQPPISVLNENEQSPETSIADTNLSESHQITNTSNTEYTVTAPPPPPPPEPPIKKAKPDTEKEEPTPPLPKSPPPQSSPPSKMLPQTPPLLPSEPPEPPEEIDIQPRVEIDYNNLSKQMLIPLDQLDQYKALQDAAQQHALQRQQQQQQDDGSSSNLLATREQATTPTGLIQQQLLLQQHQHLAAAQGLHSPQPQFLQIPMSTPMSIPMMYHPSSSFTGGIPVQAGSPMMVATHNQNLAAALAASQGHHGLHSAYGHQGLTLSAAGYHAAAAQQQMQPILINAATGLPIGAGHSSFPSAQMMQHPLFAAAIQQQQHQQQQQQVAAAIAAQQQQQQQQQVGVQFVMGPGGVQVPVLVRHAMPRQPPM